ncbi:GNAT family N-acetyltransferase [Desulfuromonas sp. KJ2020]|uniref:GNAT family N-acetyltransferase n=1 Tax=Desulfuromonas sp. KJ2020 TaxID=2919173 RepID=UPI0020A77D31|nr:GNAT family N-acetyltransferase [Desulfuromonas sp. KJ2020]MCP3178136.1 GNAT family N-acetyltransferase [Desulfuromonas sp. KJ2020]
MRLIKILYGRYKELSFKEFVGLVKESLFFSEPILVYQYDISQRVSTPVEPVVGVTIKKGDSHDLEQAHRLNKPVPWEFECNKYDGVKDFFVASDENGVQHISWIYYHDNRNRLLSLGPQEAEIKFCLTLPALRGRGIYPKVILTILNYLSERGIKRVYMCVHRDNHSSIRGIEKAGFHNVGEMVLKKMFGFQFSPRFETARIQ